MSPRRILTALGPALALAVFASGLVCGCLPWSLDLPGATGFVGRGLAESYGVALSAQGRTRVSLLPLPRIGFSGVRLSAAGPDGPVLVDGGSLTLQLGLAALLVGRVEVASLTLEGAAITLPEGADDPRWSGLFRALAREGAGHPRRIVLRGATVTGRDPRDGRPETAREVDLTLSWPLWSDTLDLAGSAAWNGVSTRFGLIGLRPGSLLSGGESPFSMTLAWPTGSASAQGSARIEGGLALSGQLGLETHSLPETLAWTGGGRARPPHGGSFSLDGRFELSGESLRLPSLRVSAGPTVLEGAASVEMAGRRPSIRATLDAREVNLAPVLAGFLRLAGLDGEPGWGRTPLALSPLTGGDLDLRLSGASARLGPVVMEDLAAGVIVRADRIDATLGRASLQGGTLKGRLALAASDDPEGGTQLRTQGAFEGIDLGALLVDLGEAGWMLGKAHGSFAFEGRGRDMEDLVRQVAGRAAFGIDGGTLAGLDLADVVQRGGSVAPGALARRNGRTAFERARVSLVFGDGLGEIEEATLTARAMTASLRGTVSLPERRLLARAALLPRKTASGEAASAQGATQFEIAGPWDALRVAVLPRGDESDPGEALLRGPSAAPPRLPNQMRAYAP